MVYTLLLCILLHLPTGIIAQCNCPNGETPMTTVHQRNITTSMEETVLNFPQFDPAEGTLICTNVNATITAITRIRIENDEMFAADYKINYSRTSTISGPGLDPTLVSSFSKSYGPYHLAESDGVYFSGADYIITNKDTVLNKKQLTRTMSGDVSAFLGSGTVSYTYNLSTLSKISGGGNYLGGPLTSDVIDFRLTYTYCPMTLLGGWLKDFTVKAEDAQNISVDWKTLEQTNGQRYAVELSTDNKSFSSIASFVSSSPDKGEYRFVYHPKNTPSGKLYFRISKTGPDGHTMLSGVKTINLHSSEVKGQLVYPNPANRLVSLEFSQPIKNNLLVEIMGISGNIVQKEQISMNNTNAATIRLKDLPPGIYFLKSTDQASGGKYFSRLAIK